MDKLFLTILNMSLTGAFVIAAICLARLPLKKAPKIISYCLWVVAGFRLVFPFSIESVFSLIPFKAQLIPQDIAMQAFPRIDSGIGVIDNAISTSLPAASTVASVNPLQIWQFIGSYIWFFGVAVLLIYGAVSFVILKQKMKKSIHIEANVYEAENIQSPFVLGIFKPRIYLPIGLSEHERNYIILHEQTHIRRYDHIIKFAAYFILCLHWFNPLAWVAFLLMGVDMEMSCDERVLKEMGGDTKKDYSLSLLSLATERRVIGGSPLAFSEGGLKARIRNVLNFKKPSRVIIVAAVALVAVLSVGFAMNRTERKPPDISSFSLSNIVWYNDSRMEDITPKNDLTQFFDILSRVTLNDRSAVKPDANQLAVYTIYGQNEGVSSSIEIGDENYIHVSGFFGIDKYYVIQNPQELRDFLDRQRDSITTLYDDTTPIDVQSQITAYLSNLFTEAYSPYYDGLHYETSNYEETVTDGIHTATFIWRMYHLGNGLDVPSDLGKEQEVNFNLQTTAKLDSNGLLNLETIQTLVDTSAVGAPNYSEPVENHFPPKLATEAPADLGDASIDEITDNAYLWPLADYTRISAPFGTRIHPIEKTEVTHDGVDIAASTGTAILASKAGTIIEIDANDTDGLYVMLDHGAGLQTFYAQMNEYAEGLTNGDPVKQGDVIGYVGSTGESTGSHLHFGISIDGVYINPLEEFN